VPSILDELTASWRRSGARNNSLSPIQTFGVITRQRRRCLFERAKQTFVIKTCRRKFAGMVISSARQVITG